MQWLQGTLSEIQAKERDGDGDGDAMGKTAEDVERPIPTLKTSLIKQQWIQANC